MVQHAESKSKEEDSTRPLSEKGLKDFGKIAVYANNNLHILAKQIFHSGKLRAQQTAEILADCLTPQKEVKVNKNLEPLADPRIWQSLLAGTTEDIAIVGHLPHLSKLASALLIHDENKEIVAFRTGAILCLERDQQSRWAIQWFVTPETIP